MAISHQTKVGDELWFELEKMDLVPWKLSKVLAWILVVEITTIENARVFFLGDTYTIFGVNFGGW